MLYEAVVTSQPSHCSELHNLTQDTGVDGDAPLHPTRPCGGLYQDSVPGFPSLLREGTEHALAREHTIPYYFDSTIDAVLASTTNIGNVPCGKTRVQL